MILSSFLSSSWWDFDLILVEAGPEAAACFLERWGQLSGLVDCIHVVADTQAGVAVIQLAPKSMIPQDCSRHLF